MEKQYINQAHRKLSYTLINHQKEDTLIFIHGAGSNFDQFFPQYEYFKNEFNICNLTLHGHDSFFSSDLLFKEDFTLEKMAKDVIWLIDSLNLKDVLIIGNSAGGLVGLEMIKQDYKNIKSIVTFGTAPRLMYPKFLISLISKLDKRMLNKRPEKYLRFAAKACSKNQDVINRMTHIMMTSKHAAPLIRAQIGRYDYLDVIQTMNVPYLLICGPYDQSINKALKPHMKMLESLPHFKKIDIEKAGHFANLDQPILFNQIIKTFITQNSFTKNI